MTLVDLTQAENKIIEMIREFKPFERLEITKDKEGKADTYLVHRSQKVIITSHTVIQRMVC